MSEEHEYENREKKLRLIPKDINKELIDIQIGSGGDPICN